MNTSPLRGLWTALITPFMGGDGISNPVDHDALDRLIDMQISGGVTGVLFLGTTGENPTLTDDEGMAIVRRGIDRIGGRAKVMVNVGTYSTQASLENMKRYEGIEGIDAYLLVNPYYNKPTQQGLFLHFTILAQATSHPIFIYNIKGRCAVNLENETLLRMITLCPNIVGVKEASGDIDQISKLIQSRPPGFLVLSGDDAMTYDVSKLGGDGVVSVASNALPREMKQYTNACLSSDETTGQMRDHLTPFFENLFIQSNPLPVKTYLARKGIIHETFRLPICPMDSLLRAEFLEFIDKFETTSHSS